MWKDLFQLACCIPPSVFSTTLSVPKCGSLFQGHILLALPYKNLLIMGHAHVHSSTIHSSQDMETEDVHQKRYGQKRCPKEDAS